MNINSITTNLLLNKTLLHNSPSNLATSTTFDSLLKQTLLQAEMIKSENSSGNSIADFFTRSNSLNLAALGLNLELLGTDQNGIKELFSRINSGNTAGVSLEYDKVSSKELDSQLKGALNGAGQHFVEAGKKYQISPALIAAISIHETGNGSSNVALYKHNVAGMMGKNGLKTYDSVQESIFDMARNLRQNYLDQGKSTIAEIGAKYAPIGSSNDPTNLNNHWVNGVQRYFDTLTKTTDFA